MFPLLTKVLLLPFRRCCRFDRWLELWPPAQKKVQPKAVGKGIWGEFRRLVAWQAPPDTVELHSRYACMGNFGRLDPDRILRVESFFLRRLASNACKAGGTCPVSDSFLRVDVGLPGDELSGVACGGKCRTRARTTSETRSATSRSVTTEETRCTSEGNNPGSNILTSC